MNSFCEQGIAWGLTRITAPAAPVVTLEELRAQMRVDPDPDTSPPSNPEDALILACGEAATDELDGLDGWLGRALVTQTWRLALNRFPSGSIYLPFPPLQEVTGITYLDRDGVETTLDPSDYRVGTEGEVAYVAAAHGRRFPTGRDQGGAVGITFTAGYGDTGADVPAIIRRWILARAATYFEHREDFVIGSGLTVPVVPVYSHALANVRVRGVLS